MVSKYDIFYVIATKGEIRVSDIVKALHKSTKEYKIIFNHVMELEKEGYIKRNKTVRIIHNEKSKKLFWLISFCINNAINYNLMFKKTMLGFIQKAAKKEFFTIGDVRVHQQTFRFYVDVLSSYGLLLTISKKPLKCKLLRHHFFIDLMKFFRMKAQFYAPKQNRFINEIKKELEKYKRNLKIHYTVIQDLEKKEEINFIHMSLNLEGNPLTLPETQKLLLEEIVPEKRKLTSIQEVTNYKDAVDLMIENSKKKIKLDLPLILKYHKLAMAHITDAGKIRKENVMIRFNPDFKTCDWKLLNLKLNELMKEYERFESEKKDTEQKLLQKNRFRSVSSNSKKSKEFDNIEKIIEFASFFHNEFQRIHPFIDGNSRTSRLLMLHIFRSCDFPVLELPLGYFDLYMDLTKRSKKRDDKAFKNLIEEVVFINLKKINGGVG